MAKKKPTRKLGLFITLGDEYGFLQLLLSSARSKMGELEFFIFTNSLNEDSVRLSKILGRRKGINSKLVKKPVSHAEALNTLLGWAIEENIETAVFCTATSLLHEGCIDTLVSQLDAEPTELLACAVDAKRIVEVVNQFPFMKPESLQKLNPKQDPVADLKDALDTIKLTSGQPYATYGLIDYACFAVRPKQLAEKVGLFDESFAGRHWEDLDMHWRLAEADIKTSSVINALFLNTKVEDLTDIVVAGQHFIPNGFYFAKKHGLIFKQEQLIKDKQGNLQNVRPFEPAEAFTVYENELDRRIYDCLVFEDNLDLLELRIKLLYPYVDFFVIAEANKDLQGNEKPLYLRDNKERFAAYSSKIRRLIIQDFKKANTEEERKALLTKSLLAGLKDARHLDLIMVSEINQIPDTRKVREFMRMPSVKVVNHLNLLGCLNFSTGTNTEGTRYGTMKTLNDDYAGNLAAFAGSAGFKIKNGGISIEPKPQELKALVDGGQAFPITLSYHHMPVMPQDTVTSPGWIHKFITHKGASFVDSSLDLYDNKIRN